MISALTKTLGILFLASCSLSLFGQQSVSLEQAEEMALQNNLNIQSMALEVSAFKESKKTSTEIGKLSATWMHGQYNSVYQDNNITLTESIPFPTAISSQLRLGKEQLIGAQKNLQSSKNDLLFEVRSLYLQVLYLNALRGLLQSQDSLFADFARASALRYQTGESNLLEKTTAETQWLDSKNQARQNEADILIAGSSLQTLLKSNQPVTASEAFHKRELPALTDTAALSNNPQLQYLQQQVTIGAQFRRTEVNRILPDITFGYFNQSLIGVQNINGQDQYFGRGKRFQGFQLGLAIPIWIAPQIAKVRAAGYHEESLRKKAEYFQTRLAGRYVQSLQEAEKDLAVLHYYENSALQNAALIISQARTAYRGGEIGYIEYLQSLKTALGIKSGYLHALNQYNQAVAKIEFLLGTF